VPLLLLLLLLLVLMPPLLLLLWLTMHVLLRGCWAARLSGLGRPVMAAQEAPAAGGGVGWGGGKQGINTCKVWHVWHELCGAGVLGQHPRGCADGERHPGGEGARPTLLRAPQAWLQVSNGSI
jgi:hypothetical protein